MVTAETPLSHLCRLAGAQLSRIIIVLTLLTGCAIVAAPSGATEANGIGLQVAPSSAIVPENDPLTIEVRIENTGKSLLEPGTVSVEISSDPITRRSQLSKWTGGTTSGVETSSLGHVTSGAIAPGATTTVALTVPPEAMPPAGSRTRAYGLAATLGVAGQSVATGTGSVVRGTQNAGTSVGLTLAYPLTVPANSTGLISAGTLAEWTEPLGLLTRQLDAVANKPVAIAIDPSIIASIQALGSTAPPSVTAWLKRLNELSNETFPLAYADADLSAQAQAGFPAPLSPKTFSDVVDPGKTGGGQTAAPGASATPESGSDLPTWNYTRTDIAWPPAGTVTGDELGYLHNAGLQTTLISSTNVEHSPGVTDGAAAKIGDYRALVTDDEISTALHQAATAASEVSWHNALATVSAQLAVIASDGGADRRTVLGVFGRDIPPSSQQISGVIDSLASAPFARMTALAGAADSEPDSQKLIESPESTERVETARGLAQNEETLNQFATVLENPTPITSPARRSTLALLSVSWLADPASWKTAVDDYQKTTETTLASVTIVPSSEVLVLASQSEIPVVVNNNLSAPVTVKVDVAPTNGRLIVEDVPQTKIEPKSRSTIWVPVAARIGNGDVTLSASLYSPAGVQISPPITIAANVQADWEGVGAVAFGALVVLLFTFGLWRNIARRRQARAAGSEIVATPDSHSENTSR